MKKNNYIQPTTADATFLTMHTNICSKVPGIAQLASLALAVAAVQDKLDLFSVAYTASLGGNRAQAAMKNTAKQALSEESKLLVDGINRIAKDNLEILLETGYPVGEGRKGPVELFPLKGLTVVNGKVLGQIIAKADPGDGTAYTLMEYGIGDTLESVTNWIACPDTTNTCIINGLISGTRIWVRATAVGRRGQKLPFPPVTTLVL